MALNKFMHPRNIYKSRKPDFAQLAVDYPAFQTHVTQDLSGKVYLDFKNPESLRALTLTLLKHDFSLTVDLPLDRLIPTVPLRLNYIHWLEDILSDTDDILTGIDIGTGSSCIYPLLSCRLNPKWMFQATDVDAVNIEYANKNVLNNGLQERITVRQVTGSTILLETVQDGDGDRQFDFCMCNPPFFADHMDAQAVLSTRSDERPDPSSVSTAHEVESIVRGGEVGFVNRMIAESMKLKHTVRVYSTMIGKKTSIALIKDELRRFQVPRYATTEFCQGKTMRWGIAWSFDVTVKFPKSSFQEKHKEKPPLTHKIPDNAMSGVVYELSPLAENIKDILKELQIEFEEVKTSKDWLSIQLCARQNTWSHQRRKRRQMKRESITTPANPDGVPRGTPDVTIDESSITTDTRCHMNSKAIIVTDVSINTKDVLDDCDHSKHVLCHSAGDVSIEKPQKTSCPLNEHSQQCPLVGEETPKSVGMNSDLDDTKRSVPFPAKTENACTHGCSLDLEKDLLVAKPANHVNTCQMITSQPEPEVDRDETNQCSKKRPHDEDITCEEEADSKKQNSSPARSITDEGMNNDNHLLKRNCDGDVKTSVCSTISGDSSQLVSLSTDANHRADSLGTSNTSCDTSEEIQNEILSSSHPKESAKKNNSTKIHGTEDQLLSSDVTSKAVSSSSTQITETCPSESTHSSDSKLADVVGLNETEYLFRSILTLKKVGTNFHIEMSWIDGCNKELMHQLFQFFKNKFI